MLEHDPTEATAENPSGPAGSEDAAASAFARLLAAEDADEAPATPSPRDDHEQEDADDSPVDEPAEDEEATDDTEDESEDDEEPPTEPTYTVKVDGKAMEVPASELVKGYQRYADYTRKTTEVAEQRKALDGELQSIASVREEYGKRLDQLAQALKQSSGEPDWERLKAEDPIGFATQFADYQIRLQQTQAIEREQQRIRQESEQQQAEAHKAYLAEQQKRLLDVVPEWKDAKKAKAEHSAILDYAKAQGFRDEELAQVTDHRLVLLLRDAARYRQLAEKVKATPVPSAKSPKVGTPALQPKGTRAPTSDLTKQRQRLAKTGNEKDAAPIFLAMLEREGKRR
jgi:hypothetical protein